MKLLECETFSSMGRLAHRRLWTEFREGIMGSLFQQFGFSEIKPENVDINSRPLIEVVYLNWRLVRNGHFPLDPNLSNDQLNQIGRTSRKLQFAVLEQLGLLR